MGTPSGRIERITATGWRIVGALPPTLGEAAPGFEPLLADDVLFAATFRLRPKLGANVVASTLGAIDEGLRPLRSSDAPIARNTRIEENAGRFQGLHWATHDVDGRWLGELHYRTVHPAIPGVPSITQMVIEDNAGHVTLTLRTGTPGGLSAVRGLVGAGQSRPAFLSSINRTVRMLFDDGGPEPRVLGDADVDTFVTDVLLSEKRDYPVAVLAPQEDGSYPVAPEFLADELLGLAHLYVMDRHPTTFRLSDSLGDRRLSCYWGALRVYNADFSAAARPEDHPLHFPDRVADPVLRAGIIGSIAYARRASVPAPAVPSPPQTTPAPAVATLPPSVSETLPTPPPPRDATVSSATLEGKIADLTSMMGTLLEMNRSLVDEIARLRTTAAVRAGNASGVERRMSRVEKALREILGLVSPANASVASPPQSLPELEVPEEEPSEVTLVSVVRQTMAAHGDALLILDDAERSAAESPFEDVDRVAVILDAMAMLARRRQAGSLGMSLREAFRDLGIDYRGGITRTTSPRLRQQYQMRLASGVMVDCEEHIALGNTYDPRYCLRIYFSSRAPAEARFVIAHVGRHFDVETTT